MKVEWTTSDSHEFLFVKGDCTKEEILKLAKEQNVVDDGDFNDADYFQSHFKCVPARGNSGYRTWNYPIDKPCRGSYFASVLQKG